MDKEGQPVQFSSDKITEKENPDFFIASNDKPSVEKKLGLDKIKSSQKSYFKNFVSKLTNFFKHPFRGKHKIISISVIVLTIIAVILLILSFTVWRSTQEKDYNPLSEEALEAWSNELDEITTRVSQLSDDEFKNEYAELIKNERVEQKALDLTISYARELAYRGFVDSALGFLDAINIDDLVCQQMVDYYAAYGFTYYVMGNLTESAQSEYYIDLANEQELTCITERTGIEPVLEDTNSEGESDAAE